MATPYTIKQGDTLSQIALSNNSSVEELMGLNKDITNPDKIYAGYSLNLPGTKPTTKDQTPITADTLTGGTNKIDIPEQPTGTNYQEIVDNVPEEKKEETGDDRFKALMKSFMSSSEAPTDLTKGTSLEDLESDVDEKTAIKNDLVSQLKAISNTTTARNLGLENQSASITSGGVARSQNANVREAAIRALPIQAQLDAAQNNLTAARDKLAQVFQIKSEYAKELYKYNQDLRDKVYEYATAEQKAKLDAQAKADDRLYQEGRENLTRLQNLSDKAMENEQPELAAKITQLDHNSETFAQDLAELQSQMVQKVDPAEALDIKLKNLQILKAQKDLTEPSGVDTSNLTPQQRSAAAVLATQLHGTIRSEAQIENFLNPILQRMAGGESIDSIADDLRFQGQSPEFAGVIRNAAQQITSKVGDAKTQTVFDKLDDAIFSGDIGVVRDYLKKISLDYGVSADEAKQIRGKERTVEFLDEIKDDLETYESKGGDTNFFTGNIEALLGKVGQVKDKELRKTATKIATAIQSYRRAMSGVAFSVPESEDYKKMFPNIDKTAEFNTANIDALVETFQGDLDYLYGFIMGDDAYDQIFKNNMATTNIGAETSYLNSVIGAIEGISNDSYGIYNLGNNNYLNNNN